METNRTLQQISPLWQRAVYMLLFLLITGVVKFVSFAVIAMQFLVVLVNDKPNENLLKLGRGLSTYTYQIMLYLTFNSEQLPYPFSKWPD